MRKMRRKLGLLATGAMVYAFPFGGCQIGEITTSATTTVDGREVIIGLVREAILSPIDAWITAGVNQVFDELVDETE
jgi:hypothetical protein